MFIVLCAFNEEQRTTQQPNICIQRIMWHLCVCVCIEVMVIVYNKRGNFDCTREHNRIRWKVHFSARRAYRRETESIRTRKNAFIIRCQWTSANHFFTIPPFFPSILYTYYFTRLCWLIRSFLFLFRSVLFSLDIIAMAL